MNAGQVVEHVDGGLDKCRHRQMVCIDIVGEQQSRLREFHQFKFQSVWKHDLRVREQPGRRDALVSW